MYALPLKTLLLIYSCIGAIAASYAKRYKLNPYVWFFLGAFFGILALIALFFLIRKRSINISKPTKAQMPLLMIKERDSSKLWYYLNAEKKEFGPMSLSKLYNIFKEGKISDSTYVWNEDLENWIFLKDADIYKNYFLSS